MIVDDSCIKSGGLVLGTAAALGLPHGSIRLTYQHVTAVVVRLSSSTVYAHRAIDFCMVIKVDYRKFFYRIDHVSDADQKYLRCEC